MSSPRLILLNGVPAAGKTTVARMWADRHPPSLVLDLDTVRSMIGAAGDDPGAAGLLAREIGLAMAREHLAAGHDVIVPQYLGRDGFISRLGATAGASGAVFVEVLLGIDPADAERRFAERTVVGAERAHRDAAAIQSASGDTIAMQHERLLRLTAARPGTVHVPSVPGDPVGTLEALDRALGLAPAD